MPTNTCSHGVEVGNYCSKCEHEIVRGPRVPAETVNDGLSEDEVRQIHCGLHRVVVNNEAFVPEPRRPTSESERRFFAQGDASYVLDWLRQTEAPSNIIRLQEYAVEQLGGYLGAVARITTGRRP